MNGDVYYIAGERIAKHAPIYIKDDRAWQAKRLNHFIKGWGHAEVEANELVRLIPVKKEQNE